MAAYSEDPWTEAQWAQVQEAVRDEAKKQRVAASFLPLYGPLPEDAQTVSLQELETCPNDAGTASFLEVKDHDTRRLTTLSVTVGLRSAQLSQPDLASALVAFRRAANLIARAEDYLVFNGQTQTSPPLPALQPCQATGGDVFDGMIQSAENAGQKLLVGPGVTGPELVDLVVQATSMLEQNGHLGPFALVLNTNLFALAHNPTNSLVLPADRIRPLLDGPLLRSSTLGPGRRGILVSLGGELADLVVASEIKVRFVQITATPSLRYVYRVSQRFTLRIKQPTAFALLS